MFFCCQDKEEKGKHFIQAFQTPKSSSAISSEKDITLKASFPQGDSKPKSIFLSNVVNEEKPKIKKAPATYLRRNHQEGFVLKKIMKSNYQKLIDEYAKSNKKWTDPDFPPNQKSFGVGKDAEKVVWRRVDQIIQNPEMIKQKISPGDILQGKIGNCYFLSAIAGLAQEESRIRCIFGSTEMNPNGIYMARVMNKGVYQQVIVDDYFPCSQKDGKIVGARPSGGTEIWVMILQKCWAKLYGSYEAIEGGLCNQVLHAFSAAPTFQFQTNTSPEEEETLFSKMLQASNNQQIVCCGTNPDSEIEKVGLVEGHAYTILDVYDKPRRLLKVRNPWGENQWTGRGSERDTAFWKKVSANDKKKLGFEQKDDGIFWIFWEDFLTYFGIVDICKIDDKAHYYYEEFTYKKDKPNFSCLKTHGTAILSLAQIDTRGKEVPKPRYARSTIIVVKRKSTKGQEQYQYVASHSERNVCESNMELDDLQAGDYIVYSALSGRNPSEDATLSCYSQSPVELVLAPQVKEQDFLHQVFLDHARKNTASQQKIFGDNVDIWICMEIVYESGFGYTVIHVGSKAKTKLGLTFHEEEYTENNFQLLPPYKGSGEFKIVCESGNDSIVLCHIVPQEQAIEASMPIPSIKRLS